jgi:hypothetical protein
VERRKNREREGRQDTQPLRSVGEAGVPSQRITRAPGFSGAVERISLIASLLLYEESVGKKTDGTGNKTRAAYPSRRRSLEKIIIVVSD